MRRCDRVAVLAIRAQRADRGIQSALERAAQPVAIEQNPLFIELGEQVAVVQRYRIAHAAG